MFFEKILSILKEKRRNFKFLFKLRKSSIKILHLLREVYDDAFLSLARVFDFFNGFQDSRKYIEVCFRSDRPSKSKTVKKIEKISNLI